MPVEPTLTFAPDDLKKDIEANPEKYGKGLVPIFSNQFQIIATEDNFRIIFSESVGP